MDGRGSTLRSALTVCASIVLAASSIDAQGVDPRGDWVTLATPHFRVHFRSGLEEQGRRAAADAERAWGRLAAELAPPRGPVELVVADNADLSNGYATPLPSNRIVVYAQPPVDVSSLRFYDDWLELVITHELTHVFHLDRARGVWGALQHVFGRNPALFPNAYSPSWLKEGLAVYFESRLTGAGRLVGTEHRLIARAAAVDARVPRIDQLSLAGSVFPLGDRTYAYGSLLVDYVAHAGGPENVRRFVDRESAMLLPWRLDHAARRSFGLSFSEGWTRWRDSVTRSVAAAAPSGDAWRELTGDGWFVEAPRWLGAGSLVVGMNDGRSVAGAERVDINGRQRRLGRRNSLSPNVPLPGGGLLFAQIDYADPFTIRSDLYVQADTAPVAQFGAASRGQRRLTFGARLSHPDARADGAIVAVQSGGGSTWLARVSPDGRTVVPLTAASPDTQWTEPRWSPDGRRLAAVQLVRGGRSAVVILDTAARARFDVVRDRAVNATPSWSPDGRRVYWSSDRTGVPQLYVAAVGATARETEPARISGAATGITEPVPGPTNGALAGLLYRVDGFHLALIDTARLAPASASADPASYDQTSRVVATAERATGAVAGYNPLHTLWPRYWMPVVGVSDGNSATLGGATSGYDVLGRHSYAVQATWNVDNGDAEGYAAYRYSRLVRPFVDLSGSQSWQYDTVPVRFTNGTAGELPLDRRTRAGGVTLTFTRPRVRTGASLGIGALYEQRQYSSTNAGVSTFYADRLGTSFPTVFASGSWVNTRRPVRSISPEDGIAVSGSVQQRWQNGTLGPQSRRAVGAARLYRSLDLPGFAHHVLALRVAGGVTDANTATELTAGGVSGSAAEIVPGVRVGDPARTFGVRGFGSRAQVGLRAAAASVEYRAPLSVPARGVRLLPVFADRLSLSAFADAASAWCPASVDRTVQTLCLTSTRRSPTTPRWLASAGAELALDAALSYDVPYRFRLGVAAPVAQRDLAPRAVSPYFTLGLSF